MGYTVLYIAFGIVALWLLGEVLLQYKARLRWRVLAFAGFMGVVGGVYLREVIVIVLGAVAFGTGQTFVTLSYRRGFSTGWAIGGKPGSSRRRKGGPPAGETAPSAEPTLEVSPVEEVAAGPGDPMSLLTLAEDPQVYQPMPMHEDSGEYPLYDGQSSYTPDPYTSGGYEGYGAQGYAGWGGEQQPAAASYESAYGTYGTGEYGSGEYGSGTYGTGTYGTGTYGGYGQEQPGQPGQPGWEAQQSYDAAQYSGYDTPPGGVWAPQTDEQQQYAQSAYIPQQPQQPPYEPQPQAWPQGQDPYHY